MKKLQRNKNDSVIGGVCSGIAEYLNTDPLFIRLGFIVLGVITAVLPVILAYICLWVLMPAKEE